MNDISFEVATVPSTYYGNSVVLPNVELPEFERIVALPDETGNMIWSTTEGAGGNNYYDPTTAIVSELTLPETLYGRLLGFHEQYSAGEREQQVGYYNCHRFALWMGGVLAAHDFSLPDTPNRIVFDGVRLDLSPDDDSIGGAEYLDMGVHGVVGAHRLDYIPTAPYPSSRAWHSLVGLGLDTPYCLQVSGFGGHLGVANYSDVMRLYQDPEARVGLFVLSD